MQPDPYTLPRVTLNTNTSNGAAEVRILLLFSLFKTWFLFPLELIRSEVWCNQVTCLTSSLYLVLNWLCSLLSYLRGNAIDENIKSTIQYSLNFKKNGIRAAEDDIKCYTNTRHRLDYDNCYATSSFPWTKLVMPYLNGISFFTFTAHSSAFCTTSSFSSG